MKYTSIRPGKEWLDTDGNLIQAHGGSVMYYNGKYYWYGENKEKTVSEKIIWHWVSFKRYRQHYIFYCMQNRIT